MRRTRWRAALAGVALLTGLGASRAGAQTAPSPLMRAIALPALVPALAAELAPITVELPPGPTDLAASRIRIVGLTWCGGDEAGGARALGIVYPEEAAAPAVNALSPADCDRDLKSLAGRISLASIHSPWAAVIKLRATWRPWRLTLAVLDAAGVGASNPAAALRSVGEIKSISTARLNVLPPPGDGYRFDLALKFTPATVIAILFASGGVADPGPFFDDPSLKAEPAAAPPDANLVADARYGFIDRMLQTYAPVYEVPFRVQGMNQPLTLRDVVAAGGDNTMTLRGVIEYSGMAYNGTMVAQGEDLRVASIGLDAANQGGCNMEDMIARLQCQANQLTNGGAGRALAAGLTNYYQGQPFHYSTGNRPLRFVLGDVEFAADLAALKSQSRVKIFSQSGRAQIRRLGAVGAP